MDAATLSAPRRPSMKRAFAILAIPALGVSGVRASCDEPGVVAPDAIVRVKAPTQDKRVIVGKVVSVDDKTLALRIDTLSQDHHYTITKVPVAGIQRVDVWHPTSRSMMGPGALLGGGIGLALDLSLLGIVVAKGRSCGDDCGLSAEVLAVPPVTGVLVGGLIGAMLKAHRWEPAFLPPPIQGRPQVTLAIAPTSHRGLRGGLTVRF
jgi:hypothetical protein